MIADILVAKFTRKPASSKRIFKLCTTRLLTMTTAGGSLRLGRQEIHLSFLKLFSLVVRISWFTYCLHIYCTNNFFPRLFHSKYKASHQHSARTGTSLVLRWILFLTPSPPDTLDRDPRYPTPPRRGI